MEIAARQPQSILIERRNYHDQTWNQILQGWVITLPRLRWHPPNKTPVFSSKTFSKPVDNHARLCYNKGVPKGNKKKKRKEENKND